MPLYLQPPPAPPNSTSPGRGCCGGPNAVAALGSEIARTARAAAPLGPVAVQSRRPHSPRPPGRRSAPVLFPEPAPTSPARPLAPRRVRHSRACTNPPRPARCDPAPPSRRLPANQARASPGQPKPPEEEPMAEEDKSCRREGRGAGRPRLSRGLKAAGAGPGCGESL